MSRSHMLYDDRPLGQEAVRTSKWSGKWDPSSFHKGGGVLIEGIFHKKTTHVIQDTDGQKVRFNIFHIELKQCCRRRFGADGKEMEANFGESGLVNTGYLNSSYKSEVKLTPDTLNYQQTVSTLKGPLSDRVTPDHAQSLCLWGEESVYSHVEVDYGMSVRVKTRGDTPLIESLTKLDTAQKSHSSNYTGGAKAGQSWTDKVLTVKQQPETETKEEVKGEVDEDEWDD